jgi:hypothetical protein
MRNHDALAFSEVVGLSLDTPSHRSEIRPVLIDAAGHYFDKAGGRSVAHFGLVEHRVMEDLTAVATPEEFRQVLADL